MVQITKDDIGERSSLKEVDLRVLEARFKILLKFSKDFLGALKYVDV